MDEYEGHVRVVTTTDVFEEVKKQSYDDPRIVEDIMLISSRGVTYANLYVLNFDTCVIRTQVTAFALLQIAIINMIQPII